MGSCNIKIDGIGETKDADEIIAEFESIRKTHQNVVDVEIKNVIDKQIQIINSMCWPTLKTKSGNVNKQERAPEGVTKEIQLANDLVLMVLTNVDSSKISDVNQRDIDITVTDLVKNCKKKFLEYAVDGLKEEYDTFLCYLLMYGANTISYNLLKDKIKQFGKENDPIASEKALFLGVFKIWDLLRKIDYLNDDKLREIFCSNVIKKLCGIQNRNKAVYEGLKSLKETIQELITTNKSAKNVCSYCENEENIQRKFREWLYSTYYEKTSNINWLRFRMSYAYINDKLSTNDKEGLKIRMKKLQQEIEELRKSFAIITPNCKLPKENSNELRESADNYNNGHNALQLNHELKIVEKEVVDIWLKEIKGQHKNIGTKVETAALVPPSNIDLGAAFGSVKCLQVNLNHSQIAWKKLLELYLTAQSSDDSPIADIVFIQEPYLERKSDSNYIHFPLQPDNYSVIHNVYLTKDFPKNNKMDDYWTAAILVRDAVNFQRIMPVTSKNGQDYNYQQLVAGIRLSDINVNVYSIYCRPSKSLALVMEPFRSPDGINMSRTIFCMDANAFHKSWSFSEVNIAYLSGRGEDLEHFRTSCSLQVANKKKIEKNKKNDEDQKDEVAAEIVEKLLEQEQEQEENEEQEQEQEQAKENEGQKGKDQKVKKINIMENYIDVTFHTSDVSIHEWQVDPEWKYSNHPLIRFSIKSGDEKKEKIKLLGACWNGTSDGSDR